METTESAPTHIEPEKKEPQADFWRFTAELIKTALIVAVLAFTIRTFVIQPFIVEGLSMFPQFHDKDYLIVDKLSYRLHDPRRGDIVVFRYPKDERVNYVKRVIGLPGDTVRIENSTVSILNNNQEKVLQEPYVASTNKTLVNGSAGKTEYIIPENNFFVLGDNRTGSSDSRDWGEVPKYDMIGRVLIQAYPLSQFSLVPHAEYN